MGQLKRVVIVPGNDGTCVFETNWYKYLCDALNEIGLPCELRNMPDPYICRASEWLPFMKRELRVDEHTLVVGHSSGAIAAVRYAEQNKVYGILLVGTYTTDLGEENERLSGYFDTPWNWDAARANCSWICEFASTDDPYLPWSEQQEMADNLRAELHKYTDRGHFMERTCPEIFEVIQKHYTQ